MAKRPIESLSLDHLLRRSARLADALETINEIQSGLHRELQQRVKRRLELASTVLATQPPTSNSLAPLIDACAVGALSAWSKQGKVLHLEYHRERCGTMSVRRAQVPLAWMADDEQVATKAMQQDLLGQVANPSVSAAAGTGGCHE